MSDYSGAERIIMERARQITLEGFDSEHDAKHTNHEIVKAAICYLVASIDDPKLVGPTLSAYWPWSMNWWKPEDKIRNLTKAGALIAAEIDRLQREADLENTP